jgi:hypothetical protein
MYPRADGCRQMDREITDPNFANSNNYNPGCSDPSSDHHLSNGMMGVVERVLVDGFFWPKFGNLCIAHHQENRYRKRNTGQ